jgi:hypothetical protein
MPRSFRLVNPKTLDRGSSFQFVVFSAGIQFKLKDEYLPSTGEIRIQVPRNWWILLSAGNVDIAEKRLSFYAMQKLKETLSQGEPNLNLDVELAFDEIRELMRIDATTINQNSWVTIEERPKPLLQKVFISCGQYHPNEKRLGEQIKQIIDSVNGFEGYFAEYQQSLDGLSKNIFQALHEAVAFIAVMHRRDTISQEIHRGSVWIEQEIAIASFMTQTLTMPIKVRGYIQRGVKLEGVRTLIQLNPIIFETDEEVIRDAKRAIPALLAQIPLKDDSWLVS